MRKYFYFSVLVVLSTFFSPVYSADPLFLHKASIQQVKGTFQLVLPGVSHASGLRSTDALSFIQQHIDTGQVAHVRMQQNYLGFPVYGGYAVLHSKQGLSGLSSLMNPTRMNGTLYLGLDKELGQPSPTYVANAALALEHFKAAYSNAMLSEEQVTPMVYLDKDHKAFWAYRVSVLVSYDDKIPTRPTAILDANTWTPFLQWDSIKTARSNVNAIGFGGNTKVGRYQYGKELPLLQLTRDSMFGMCYMQTRVTRVINMNHLTRAPDKPIEFACKKGQESSDGFYWTGSKSNGYDEANGGYSPSNDALFFAQVIHDMYQDWYGLNALTNNGKSARLTMRVHYGKGYDNAFWDGKQMTFGDGDYYFYPLVSLGVGAHEISHGFTEQHSDLEYYGQSGGLNESFSDMAAQAAEYFSSAKNSWMIGADIIKEDTGIEALRFMDKPSRDGRSIDRADQYTEGMDVHYSSGVYNRFFYVLANQPNWDVKQAFHVMVKANMDYWIPYVKFEDAACGILSATNDLELPADDVKYALEQVGVNYQGCK